MKKKSKVILIRVDASPTIGAGHIMRMIALGQMLIDSGHKVHFATIPDNSSINLCLDSESFVIHNLNVNLQQSQQEEQFLAIAYYLEPEWVVLDGYFIPIKFEIEIKKRGYKIVRINDLSMQHTVADVLFDQNLGAEKFKHSVEPYTIKLTGLHHVLLRREFRELSILKAVTADQKKIRFLIVTGGGSPLTDKLHLDLLKILKKIFQPHWSLTLIIGQMGNNSLELKDAVRKFQYPIQIIKYTKFIARELLNTDIAIVSGGSIMWESLYMKVPFMAISLNEKQKEYIRELENMKICCDLGSVNEMYASIVSKKFLEFSNNINYRNSIIENATKLFKKSVQGPTLMEIIEGE